MRYRLMATYRGVPYEAGLGPTDADVVLFAACPPPEDLGFEPATGHWRKLVSRAEVALWESRPTGVFRGEPCLVLDDLGDRLHISYLGDDPYQAARLGYHQVEPAVFEVVTSREAVTGLTEERIPHQFQPWPSAESWRPAEEPGPAEEPRLAEPAGYPSGPAYRIGALPSPAVTARVLPPPVDRPAPPSPAETAGGLPPLPDRAVAPPQTETFRGLPPMDPAPMDPVAVPPPSEPMPAAPVVPRAEPVLEPVPAAPYAGPAVTVPRTEPAVTVPRTEPAVPAPAPGRRGRAAGRSPRAETRWIFSDLASLAAIPPAAYAVDEEVDGATCLIRTGQGFEVFTAAGGARHEVRLFHDEEAAYFYLFGLLAAEAVRDGRLVPPPRG